ncbi:MAG: corrinoid-binding protein [Spirochaetae bacterium HGW-Spirochaetae-7]|jgi:methanogenic corrinoid protein MtbC1|nr:MAG: corrinoid-binding protein [Spirochaetae bacterium HGW-Spirochaetae-7]
MLGAWSDKYGFPAIIEELLDPVLRIVGERFAMDRISLAQGYVAGKIAEDLLALLESSTEIATSRLNKRGIAVIGNAEDDYHALGRRMLGTFLQIAGWTIVDLGNDVLASTFVDKAEESGADIIGVSAMMLTNARNIARVRDEIDRRGLGGRVKLAVGGAVFVMRPDLVAEAGGDGTARTAMEAPGLFERLVYGTESSP